MVEIEDDLLVIETHWLQAQEQIQSLGEVWGLLKPEHQRNQVQVLQRLLNKIKIGQATLNGLSPDRVHRLKYAFRIKQSVKSTLKQLERWHNLFDVSYFLMAGEPNQLIDERLASIQAKVRDGKANPALTLKAFRDEVQNRSKSDMDFKFLPKDYLLPARKLLPMSTTNVARVHGRGETVLVDNFKVRQEHVMNAITKDVIDLARVLAKVDPLAFGLFKCKGVVQVTESSEVSNFEFVFEIPHGLTKPQSLRSILMDGSKLKLNERFTLAKSLAKSAIFVHMSKFVHKNISPETILLFQKNEHLDSSFLIGFESFRFAAGMTLMSSDDAWKKNLYRHPRRQGQKPEETYRMQHDVYSIGVVLLEIGLWTSFIILESGKEVLSPELNAIIVESLNTERPGDKAFSIKCAFEKLAEAKLPYRMGQRYTQVVLDCLTCLDQDNSFGDSKDFSKDGVDLGIRFMEHVSILVFFRIWSADNEAD